MLNSLSVRIFQVEGMSPASTPLMILFKKEKFLDPRMFNNFQHLLIILSKCLNVPWHYRQ